MENKRSGHWSAVVCTVLACVAAIICMLILYRAVGEFWDTKRSSGLTATGSASTDFEADLIVWRGNYSAHADTTVEAYQKIKSDAEQVRTYLLNNGVAEDEIDFGSVDISAHYESVYDEYGNYSGYVQNGYDLSQNVSITSYDVDKVEQISTDISTLIEAGVDFYSSAPEYYCTTLDDVKLDLIELATDNAKQRIDIMAASSGSEVGELLTATLGVFQITATNSGTSSYTYDGAFDTSSRYKTATITVKLNYTVK